MPLKQKEAYSSHSLLFPFDLLGQIILVIIHTREAIIMTHRTTKNSIQPWQYSLECGLKRMDTLPRHLHQRSGTISAEHYVHSINSQVGFPSGCVYHSRNSIGNIYHVISRKLICGSADNCKRGSGVYSWHCNRSPGCRFTGLVNRVQLCKDYNGFP